MTPTTTPAKGDFNPQNVLEDQLKRVLTDTNTPLWDFYTPLAAQPLWITVPASADPEKTGQNPPVCIFDGKNMAGEPTRYLGVYSSRSRAEQTLTLWTFPAPMICVASKGYQILRYLVTQGADELWLNFGLPECQYRLDPDMIDILLERPEPSDAPRSPERMVHEPEGDPAKFLQPVKELLARDAAVRAAWIFEARTDEERPRGHASYELALLMKNSDDDHLLSQVEMMAKALTPVQMDWAATMLRGEDAAFRQLAERHPPFYTAKGFLDE